MEARRCLCWQLCKSYHIISYHIISHHITSHHITSHHITSHHITSYHIISYHIISYHIISYHIKLTVVSPGVPFPTWISEKRKGNWNVYVCLIFLSSWCKGPQWANRTSNQNRPFQMRAWSCITSYPLRGLPYVWQCEPRYGE